MLPVSRIGSTHAPSLSVSHDQMRRVCTEGTAWFLVAYSYNTGLAVWFCSIGHVVLCEVVSVQ